MACIQNREVSSVASPELPTYALYMQQVGKSLSAAHMSYPCELYKKKMLDVQS